MKKNQSALFAMSGYFQEILSKFAPHQSLPQARGKLISPLSEGGRRGEPKGIQLTINSLFVMVIILFLSLIHTPHAPAESSQKNLYIINSPTEKDSYIFSPVNREQPHSALCSVTTAQEEQPAEDKPENGESKTQSTTSVGESSSPQPTQAKEGEKESGDKKAGKKVATWQILLLILAPLLVIAAAVLIMLITGSLGEKDTSHVEDRDKRKKGKIGSLKSKRDRRLQLALELLDYQKIARQGILKSDYYFRCAEGANKGENFKITKYVSRLGRRSTDGRINDIQLSSLEKKVSRSQGLIVYHEDEDIFYLVNESDVRIKVNKEWVRSAYPLHEGDRILLGDETVVLVFCREKIEVT